MQLTNKTKSITAVKSQGAQSKKPRDPNHSSAILTRYSLLPFSVSGYHWLGNNKLNTSRFMIKEYLERIDLPCLTANMNSLEKRNKGLEITQTSHDMKKDKSVCLSVFYL